MMNVYQFEDHLFLKVRLDDNLSDYEADSIHPEQVIQTGFIT